MGRIKEIVDSLKNKYQIHNLENDTYRIIQNLEHLDELGKIKSLDELNGIYKKIERLLMLEANKHEKRIQNINRRVSNLTNDAYERLGIKNDGPSFNDAVRRANEEAGLNPKTNVNSDLSFSEAVDRANKEAGIVPKTGINPDLSFSEAIEEAKRTHK